MDASGSILVGFGSEAGRHHVGEFRGPAARSVHPISPPSEMGMTVEFRCGRITSSKTRSLASGVMMELFHRRPLIERQGCRTYALTVGSGMLAPPFRYFCRSLEVHHTPAVYPAQRLFKYAIRLSSSSADKIRSYDGMPSPPFLILRRMLRSFAGAPLRSSRF
jgi:hypothetical protein